MFATEHEKTRNEKIPSLALRDRKPKRAQMLNIGKFVVIAIILHLTLLELLGKFG